MMFRLENPNTNAPASIWYGTNANGVNVGFNRQALFQSTSSQDLNKLLEYNFLVQGTDLAFGYQVLRVALSNSINGSVSNIGYADTLLPIFEGNPNTYALTHATVLNQLHPNWTRRNEGWSDANFLAFTSSSCF